MRVELPEGYVPPEPTHPQYGYLTPQEREAYEAEERSRLGIVPEAPVPGSQEAEAALEVEPPVSPWAAPAARILPAERPTSAAVEGAVTAETGLSAAGIGAPGAAGTVAAAELPDFSPASAEESPLTEESEEDELTVPGQPEPVAEPEAIVEAPPAAGWVPPAPPPDPQVAVEVAVEVEVEQTHRHAPAPERTTPHQVATDPVVEELPPVTEPEYRWDAYQQKWVSTTPSPPAAGEGGATPPPDHAAAAGGRGASSSWTSADGQRFRWDARTQQWIVEPGAPAGPAA